MRRIALTIVLCCLLAPATASAASVVVVRGAGFGHGIGMSQYGAYGYAKHGVGWQAILAHYYTGTKLGKAPNKPVRVLLRSGAGSVRIRGASVGPGGKKLNPKKTYSVSGAGGGKVRISGVGTFKAPAQVKRSGGVVTLIGSAINGITNGSYRGALEFRSSGGLSVVNSLPVDAYTRGVVAGEMPSSWSMDALKVQAVAARTYGLATRNTHGTFDLYPDTRSQVYQGVRGETKRTNLAVAQTANQVVTYKGKIVTTYFFSTSGGQTENIEYSFIGSDPQPWLKSVSDPYDSISPKHRWTFRFSPSTFGSRLGAPGSYRSIKILKTGKSPRIVKAQVTGTRGSVNVTGPQIRSRLGLYDSWATFTGVSSAQVKAPAGMARAAGTRGWLAGKFAPAPRAHELVVERRAGKRWKRVALVSTDAHGAFRAAVPTAGTYRVRAGAVAGAATRVR